METSFIRKKIEINIRNKCIKHKYLNINNYDISIYLVHYMQQLDRYIEIGYLCINFT